MHALIFWSMFCISFFGPSLKTLSQSYCNDTSVIPNTEIQSALHILASTNLKERQALFSSSDGVDLKQKLQQLEMSAGGQRQFISQLLYFGAHSKTTMEAMMPLFVIEQLGITKENLSTALIPYVKRERSELYQQAAELLDSIDYDSSSRSYDFSRYHSILQNGLDDECGLIKYMFSRSPEAALSAVTSASSMSIQPSEVILAAKSGGSAFMHLAENENWLVRLYAAEIMKLNPDTRNVEIIEQMKSDTHPLVREAAFDMSPQ